LIIFRNSQFLQGAAALGRGCGATLLSLDLSFNRRLTAAGLRAAAALSP
jgi:hypothetical protein